MLRHIRPATLAGGCAIFLWAFFAVVARFVKNVPPLELTAFGFAVAALGGFALLAWKHALHELRQRPLAWLHGVGGLFGFHAFYFFSLRLAPPTQATVIGYAWPLLTVLLSAALLGLRLRPPHIIGVGLGLLGCIVLAGQTSAFQIAAIPGYLCAFLSSVVWALYSVMARKLAAVPTGAMVGFYAVTALLSAAVHFLTEPTVWPDTVSILAMIILGIGPMGLAFFMWDYGIKRGDPRLLGTLGYLTPIGSYLLLCLFGFAAFTPLAILAAVLVGAGGLVAART